ncbi:MAG TPA: transposase [Telluribacter sp.]|jgi:putative transposase|nr:transposase [Telluribacter sp.]
MKKSKFTEAQIAFALRQSETGSRVEEICRQMGVSQATFFNRADGPVEEEVWRNGYS